MAAWMLHGPCFGEEAGARNLVFFRVKWLQAAMKGTPCVRRVQLRSFRTRLVPSVCFATSGCSCVRSSMRFLNLWLQIALEWSSSDVATCVDICRFAMWCCKTHCNGCVKVRGTAAACVILVSCAAGSRKSYWSGCIKAAKVICQQIFDDFFNFGACNLPFKILLKSASKSSFFRFGVEIRFWSCNSCCDYAQESFSV